MKPYLLLLRVRDWLGYFLIATFGFILAKGFSAPVWQIALFYAITFFYLGFTFSINDCFDTEEDKHDKSKGNPVVKGALSFRKAFRFSLALAILGASLSIFLGVKTFSLYLFLTFLSFSYSARPLRCKSRCLWDIFLHSLFFGSLLFFLPLVAFNISFTFWHYFIGFSLSYLSIILEMRNHVQDYQSDRRAGLKTTVCTLGLARSKKLLIFLTLFFPIVMARIFLFHEFWLFLGLTAVFYLAFWTRKNYRILDTYASLLYFLCLKGLIF